MSKPFDIAERALEFSIAFLNLVKLGPTTGAGNRITAS
jgi:hypothetical protein